MPQSVAVVGASETSRVGRGSLENLQRLGFEGPIYPVNPKYSTVLGLKCYPSVTSIAGDVDAVLLATSPAQSITVLEECALKSVGGVVVSSDGFAERGGEGAALERRLREIATGSGMAVCGPNCMGVLNLANGGALYIGVLDHAMRRGHVGVVLQSGSLGLALANNDRGLDFRYLISSGNEAVTTATDYLEFLVDDPGTSVIGLVLESIRDPDRLIDLVQRSADSGKPVVMLKLGTSDKGQGLAATHTGSLAGSGRVTAALCREFGIVQAADLEEFAATCQLLSESARPAGQRVGAVTLSGGSGILFADLAAGKGLHLPEWDGDTATRLAGILGRRPTNPIDAWSGGDFASTALAAAKLAAEDPSTDLVVLLQDLPPAESAHRSDVPAAVTEIASALRRSTAKPIVVWGSIWSRPEASLAGRLKADHIPYLTGGGPAIAALAAWASPHEADARKHRARPESRARPGLRWDRDLFMSHSIPMVEESLAADAGSAAAAAARFGGEVVIKVQSPDIKHKSDVGGVKRGVKAAEAGKAFDDLLAGVRRRVPHARIDGVLVQPEAPEGGLELAIGAVRDPDWGWIVSCAVGGVLIELLDDASFSKAPTDERSAAAMLRRLRAWPLLDGYRGRPRCDVEALIGVIVRLSELVVDCGNDISQLDLNPVLVYPEGQGVLAVDHLIMPAVRIDGDALREVIRT